MLDWIAAVFVVGGVWWWCAAVLSQLKVINRTLGANRLSTLRADLLHIRRDLFLLSPNYQHYSKKLDEWIKSDCATKGPEAPTELRRICDEIEVLDMIH